MTWFRCIGLELQSLALCVIAAFRRDSRNLPKPVRNTSSWCVVVGHVAVRRVDDLRICGHDALRCIGSSLAGPSADRALRLSSALYSCWLGWPSGISVAFHMDAGRVRRRTGRRSPLRRGPKIAAIALLVRTMVELLASCSPSGSKSSSSFPSPPCCWAHWQPSGRPT